jgi:uncharacterized protein (DUF983 family)
MSLVDDLVFCLKPRCPLCRKGRLYRPWTVSVVEKCAVCAAPLGQHDIGDGAAVFLLFILGFSIVPLAWVLELAFSPPLWVQAFIWSVVGTAMVAILLPATKAYIVMLEWRHLKKDGADKN